MSKKLTLMAIFLLIPLMLSCAQTVQVKEQKAQWVPLKDFVAKNQDEEAIAGVLQSLSEGWANKDKKPILSSCHVDARFMDKAGEYVSKDKMMVQQVSDWGAPSKVWYGYYDLNIEINGNMADVVCTEMRGYGPYKANFIMIKNRNEWQVFKYDWQP